MERQRLLQPFVTADSLSRRSSALQRPRAAWGVRRQGSCRLFGR